MNELEYSEEQIGYIKNFGAMGYKPDKIASILNLQISYVNNVFNNKESNFYKYYIEGKNLNDYLIDLRLIEMAQAGDLKAVQTLTIRQKTQ